MSKGPGTPVLLLSALIAALAVACVGADDLSPGVTAGPSSSRPAEHRGEHLANPPSREATQAARTPRGRSARTGDNRLARRYRKKIAAIRKRIARQAPDSEFHIVVEKPFVVIGDESPEKVKRRAERTVRWAVGRLKKAYFSKDPKRVLEIWLFADKKSYRKHTRALFGDDPDTPYGYYSPRHGALIMNIATGGGTLVHEIVHPFIEANFRDCPAWLNEGLGSLYEASSERDGDIVGLTNWRLPGLQESLRANQVPSFRTLTATTTDEFYEQDPGTNYAQARYLLYYLQEQGLLHEYYRSFHRNRRRDPTGYKTLKNVLGEDDMDDFFQRWKAYTLRLRFR